MERVVPGTPIYEMQSDIDATRTAASLMRKLWRPPSPIMDYQTLAVLVSGFFSRLRDKFAAGRVLPAKLIDKRAHIRKS